MVRGKYDYWHYLCDRVDDRGWGCGYRTLQTIISWCIHNVDRIRNKEVPGIAAIQDILVKMEDKEEGFAGSRDWIGSVEVALVLDFYCDIPGKIVHAKPGEGLDNVYEKVREHLEKTGCPAMMGGDLDASSKGIFGTCSTATGRYFLILDPHFVKGGAQTGLDLDKLVKEGWARWIRLEDFSSSSFYNICLPQVK